MRHTVLVFRAMFHEVWELERFQSANVTFNIIRGHWQWCHL